jgi:hypothetical protein
LRGVFEHSFCRRLNTQPILPKQTFLKPPSGGFCVLKNPYLVGFSHQAVRKALQNYHGFLTPLGAFRAFSFKASRLLQKRPSGCHVLDYQGFDSLKIF